MNYKVLKKFMDKQADLFFNGEMYIGILEHMPETNIWDGIQDVLVLKRKHIGFEDIYVDMGAINAIRLRPLEDSSSGRVVVSADTKIVQLDDDQTGIESTNMSGCPCHPKGKDGCCAFGGRL